MSFIIAAKLATAKQFWVAAAVTFVFTAMARWLRGVSISGALAGASVCFVIYASAGPAAVAVLAVVFALTWLSTRFGYSRKKRLGTAENQQGRTAWQVLANLSVAAACAAACAFTGNALFMLGAAAALAEAAADTVSSEIGQAHGKSARMITTWQPVAPGTSGGISAAGTAFGLTAAVVVSLVSMWLGLLPKKWLAICVMAAALGMITDSLLGATLERKALLNNNWVNFLSTLLAATVALLLA